MAVAIPTNHRVCSTAYPRYDRLRSPLPRHLAQEMIENRHISGMSIVVSLVQQHPTRTDLNNILLLRNPRNTDAANADVIPRLDDII